MVSGFSVQCSALNHRCSLTPEHNWIKKEMERVK